MPLVETMGLTRQFIRPRSLFRQLSSPKSDDTIDAIDRIDLTLHAGTTTGIVGESGSGKTTLARCLAGLLTPTAGRILLEGRDVGVPHRSDGLRRRDGRVQMVFQDPFASLNPRWPVGHIVAEPIVARGNRLARAEIDDRVMEALLAVGLHADDVKRKPHAFSGGERQRIAVARALAARPTMVILDEPTASVDPSIQAQILNLMQDLQDRHGLTYLIISHNLPVVHHLARTVGVLYRGRLIEIGPADSVVLAPQHPYTQVMMTAVPSLSSQRWRPPAIDETPRNPGSRATGCSFQHRCPKAMPRCRLEAPRLLPADAGVAVACHAIAEGH